MNKIRKFIDFLENNGYRNEIEEKNGKIKVGGSLDLRGTNITDKQKELKKVQRLCEGYNKEKRYIYYDGILWGNVRTVKKRESITIYKTPLGYCAAEDENSAHGKTLKEAIDDLTFKKLENTNTQEIVKEIKKTGKVTRAQYRALTGACQFGTEQFCRKHGIEDLEEIGLDELRKILTPDNYGAKRFWSLIDGRE